MASEKEILDFMTPEEKSSYEAAMKKAKAERDKAVRRFKQEREFWKQVEDRRDEILEHFGAVIPESVPEHSYGTATNLISDVPKE